MNHPERSVWSQQTLDDRLALGNIRDALIGESLVWPQLLTELVVHNTQFEHVSLRQAELAGAHFIDCNFVDCTFRSSDLTDSHFERCRFYDADAQTACDFSYAILRNCKFEHCDLTTATCPRTRAYGIDLHRCQASGIDFSNADFSLAIGALSAATFRDCNLAYADFSRTTLTGAVFAGSRLSHSVWHDTSLSDADLSDCDLDNIEARGLDLRGADLRDARFNRLDPREIDLTGVRLHAEQGLEILRTLGIEIE